MLETSVMPEMKQLQVELAAAKTQRGPVRGQLTKLVKRANDLIDTPPAETERTTIDELIANLQTAKENYQKFTANRPHVG